MADINDITEDRHIKIIEANDLVKIKVGTSIQGPPGEDGSTTLSAVTIVKWGNE